jgi:hypothetical protein
MRRLHIAAISCVFTLFLISPSVAQVGDTKELTVVVPAESIAKSIKPLLPYRMDIERIDESFSGSFWIKSVENVTIHKNSISFSTRVHGQDIKYSTKIGKQMLSLAVGEVNLHNDWETSFYYDKSKKTLFVKPHIESRDNIKDFSQGDILLYTILKALSDTEYAIEMNRFKTITSQFYDKALKINMDISDVYSHDNKLFVEIIPNVQVDASKR